MPTGSSTMSIKISSNVAPSPSVTLMRMLCVVASEGAAAASCNILGLTILYLVLSVAPAPDTSVKTCPDVWSASVADKVPTVVFSTADIAIALEERWIAVGALPTIDTVNACE